MLADSKPRQPGGLRFFFRISRGEIRDFQGQFAGQRADGGGRPGGVQRLANLLWRLVCAVDLTDTTNADGEIIPRQPIASPVGLWIVWLISAEGSQTAHGNWTSLALGVEGVEVGYRSEAEARFGGAGIGLGGVLNQIGLGLKKHQITSKEKAGRLVVWLFDARHLHRRQTWSPATSGELNRP